MIFLLLRGVEKEAQTQSGLGKNAFFLPALFFVKLESLYVFKNFEMLKHSGYIRLNNKHVNIMLDLGKKAEQQSLAKYGLDFVTDTYLPEKLTGLGLI